MYTDSLANYLYNSPLKRFYSYSGKNIHRIIHGNVTLKCMQIVMAYDTKHFIRSGILVVQDTSGNALRKMNRSRRAKLYMKLEDKKYGLFELKLDNTHVDEIEPSVFWFRHDGRSSLHILKSPKQAAADDGWQ